MAKANNKKTDAALFAGLNPTIDAPIQKVVPVKEGEGEAEEQVLFKVPGTYKQKCNIYIAKSELKTIKEFFTKASQEYMINHPLEE